VAILLALLLPALAGGLVWLGAQKFGWNLIWMPASAIAAASLLALEGWAGIIALGALFERFDISAE